MRSFLTGSGGNRDENDPRLQLFQLPDTATSTRAKDRVWAFDGFRADIRSDGIGGRVNLGRSS